MSSRLKVFESYSSHPWYYRTFKRLSPSDLEVVREFITANDELGYIEFERKATKLFMDLSDRPKRWREIEELIVASNAFIKR